ncbi:MAG: hypothetical protein M3Z08_08710 [Chloroflexota bacterium]|nr:hypothetical protein [Chloroflexota bacterium]
MYEGDAIQKDTFRYFFPSHSLHRNIHDRPQGVMPHLTPENQWYAEKEACRGDAWRDAFTPEKMARAVLFSPLSSLNRSGQGRAMDARAVLHESIYFHVSIFLPAAVRNGVFVMISRVRRSLRVETHPSSADTRPLSF